MPEISRDDYDEIQAWLRVIQRYLTGLRSERAKTALACAEAVSQELSDSITWQRDLGTISDKDQGRWLKLMRGSVNELEPLWNDRSQTAKHFIGKVADRLEGRSEDQRT